MKALILVGGISYKLLHLLGFGTRLRPLTLTVPKPLVEFANKPMLLHQIEALVEKGKVNTIVLAVNYKPELMMKELSNIENRLNIKIVVSVETEPLGTGGPLALAKNILINNDKEEDDGIFILNSDVICEFPFDEMKEFHKKHKCLGVKVEDPSKYGVMTHDENDSLIQQFVEKPKDYVGNKINSGIYIFSTKVLDRIQLRPTSLETEIFPMLIKERQAHLFELKGFWMDVGQPKDFLTGTCLYLSSLMRKNPKLLTYKEDKDYICGGNVLIDSENVKIGQNCLIGPNVTIGSNVTIGNGVRLQRCVIMRNAVIKDNAHIISSIIGWNSTVGKWVLLHIILTSQSRLENVTVLGDDVTIKDELYINGGIILPHKSISQNIPEPQIIM